MESFCSFGDEDLLAADDCGISDSRFSLHASFFCGVSLATLEWFSLGGVSDKGFPLFSFEFVSDARLVLLPFEGVSDSKFLLFNPGGMSDARLPLLPLGGVSDIRLALLPLGGVDARLPLLPWGLLLGLNFWPSRRNSFRDRGSEPGKLLLMLVSLESVSESCCFSVFTSTGTITVFSVSRSASSARFSCSSSSPSSSKWRSCWL